MSADPTLPTDRKELVALLRRTASQPPANLELDNGPWDFLLRQPAEAIDRQIRPVLHELVLDPDAEVRRQALSVMTNLPAAQATIDRIFEAARQATQFQTPPLLLGMAQALTTYAVQARRTKEAAALLKTLIGSRLPPPSTATVLAQHAPDFAVDIVRRHGEAAAPFAAQVAAIFAAYQRDRLLAYLALLAPLSSSLREDAWQRMQVFINLPADRAAQLAQAEGLSPSSTNPTPDDARAALGL